MKLFHLKLTIAIILSLLIVWYQQDYSQRKMDKESENTLYQVAFLPTSGLTIGWTIPAQTQKEHLQVYLDAGWLKPKIEERHWKLPIISASIDIPENPSGWQIQFAQLHSAAQAAGMSSSLSEHIIRKCHENNRDWENCTKLAVSIALAEQSGCRWRTTNCWGVMDRKLKPTKEIAFEQWLGYYDKKWAGKTPHDLYWKNNSTHYCTSEVSSGTQWYCPNWERAAMAAYNLFDKPIYNTNPNLQWAQKENGSETSKKSEN